MAQKKTNPYSRCPITAEPYAQCWQQGHAHPTKMTSHCVHNFFIYSARSCSSCTYREPVDTQSVCKESQFHTKKRIRSYLIKTVNSYLPFPSRVPVPDNFTHPDCPFILILSYFRASSYSPCSYIDLCTLDESCICRRTLLLSSPLE